MVIESRLGFPSKEKALKVASATLVVALPLAGYLARRELSLRKTKNEEQNEFELRKREALRVSDDSINSGDSGLIFSRE